MSGHTCCGVPGLHTRHTHLLHLKSFRPLFMSQPRPGSRTPMILGLSKKGDRKVISQKGLGDIIIIPVLLEVTHMVVPTDTSRGPLE